MLAQYAIDRSSILGADLAQDDVLARHQDRIAAEPADDLPQCGPDVVDDASARYRNTEIELAVALLVPAEMIGDDEGRHLATRFERFAEVFREPLAGPLLAVLGDHVFEACVAAIAAVAVITVQPHDGRRGVEQILGLDKGDRRREPRVGLRVVVGHPVPAAEQEIVPGETVALEQRHDRQIVGQHVDRVVLGDREADLEFARQIALAVERVRLVVGTRVLLPLIRLPRGAVDPDLVIGAGPR